MAKWIEFHFFQISAEIAAILIEDFVVFVSPVGKFQKNASRESVFVSLHFLSK